ncbi:MAG: ribosome maturation factor RimM [Chloroflexi bacterium]|nr:ribosome maturation factor RimM [Chloroflexota bacterium]
MTEPTSGSGVQPTEPDFLIVGKILRPHGVRGEMKVDVRTQYPEWLAEQDELYLGMDQCDPASATKFEVVSIRSHREHLLIMLEGINNREEAALHRDKYVLIRLDQAMPLEEGEYYTYQLIGMAVYTTTGEYLGDVMDIMETGANDVYVLKGSPRGEILIPDTDEVIEEVDLDERKVTINPIPGLLDD